MTPLGSVWWRSFLLQAGWNVKGLQHLGLAFALVPWLRRIYPRPQAFHAALQRHLGCFCCHPYLANILLGVLCALEESQARSVESSRDATDARAIIQVKATMAGPLAALGDHVIWATWRPWTALVGIALGLLPWGSPEVRWPVAVGTFLGIYNLGHLTLRVEGFRQGYRRGATVASWLAAWRLQRVAVGLRRSGILLGGLLWLLLSWQATVSQGWTGGLLGGVVFGIAFWMARRGWWGSRLFAVVVALGLFVQAAR